ncbi:fam-l protein [Plasmodium malariae]|uniref:Fam-l protein n=1 Tax=Plasmodium malariae TaxID=5858 RepID=A0A1D3PC44_PLAMA|nr:fam-l protein [Plasmodium malariae]SCN12541.1 fam-l protein [Plasmodium malariae]
MKQKINLLLFIKIAMFILLHCTCHFINDVSIFNSSLNENYSPGKKIVARIYRILAKYKQDKDTNMVCLKENVLNYESNNETDIPNYEKQEKKKKKLSYGSSSLSAIDHKQYMKNKSCMFETKKYSHIEKRIFKELDYIDFLQKNRAISDKIFRKVVFKKYRVRIILPLFFVLLLSTYLILDFSCGYGIVGWLLKILKNILGSEWSRPLRSFLWDLKLDFLWKTETINVVKKGTSSHIKQSWTFMTKPFLVYIIYLIPFVILFATLIFAVVYYHKKVIKYQKIKFRKR